MVKKYKFLFIAIFAILILALVPTISKADVAYTRSFPSNDGTIVLNVTGLELSDEKQYEFSIVSKGGTPTDWFLVTDYNDTSANITLSSGTTKIANVLAATNDGQLFIREKDNTEGYILNRLNVNLKLPYIGSIAYTIKDNEYILYGTSAKLYEKIGSKFGYSGDGINTSVVWKKVQDASFITKFLEIKKNESSINGLEAYLPSVPTDFSNNTHPNFASKNDGLYLLWVKRVGNNCKDVYSVIVHDGLPEATKVNQYIEGADVTAPTVKSIQIVSPKAGNYGAGQEVQIRVLFSEKIVATTAPTLKIKIGEGSEQSLTDGVVKNGTNEGYITYSYTIKATDKGQIQVTGLTGGNVTDEAENEAVLSCPALTGDNAITANLSEDEQTIAVTGVSIDKTATVQMGKTITLSATVKPTNATNKKVTWKSSDEKIATVDKNGKVTPVKEGTVEITVTTEDGSKTAKCTLTVTKDATEEQKTDDTKKDETKKDDTTADKVLPKTGVDMIAVFTIVGIVSIATIAGIKYFKFRDIK